jgi:hypothetical protein
MSFKKNKYKVIKKAISRELTDFLFHYFQNKRRVTQIFFQSKYISPYNTDHGVWTDPQAPNTFSIYGDMAFDTILEGLKYKVEDVAGYDLYPTYSYARLYKKGDILERHSDRPSCEISCTLNIGGDKWPIFYEPSGVTGAKGVKITLGPGDLLMYYGENEHWREPFTGETCGQVFLHYRDIKGKDAERSMYDGRQYPGLPYWFSSDPDGKN